MYPLHIFLPIVCWLLIIENLQVDLDEDAAQSITDSAGLITKQDFMKFAKDRKLVDFDDRKDESNKKEWAPTEQSSKVLLTTKVIPAQRRRRHSLTA